MNRDEIRKVFEQLAMSQGMWGRLLRSIDELPKFQQEEVWKDLEAQDFKEPLDVVMYYEG